MIACLFWAIIIVIWIFDFWAVVYTGGSIFTMCVLNLKYHFKQLNQQIIQQIRIKNYQNLPLLLSYHIAMEKETRLINKEVKYYMYFLYNWVKPAFNIFVCLLFMDDTVLLMRIVVALALTAIAFILFMISYLCSSVTTAAHRSQTAFYSCLMTRGNQIPIKLKIKFLRFIERLSGPQIGFSSYNLFTINSYNFADYVLDSMYSYFLIINLLKKNGFL